METVPVPRIRGNAIQVGKHWEWEFFVTVGPDEDYDNGTAEPIVLCSNREFLNKDSAIADMRKAVDQVTKVIQKALGGDGTEGLIDLKAGVFRKTLKEDK